MIALTSGQIEAWMAQLFWPFVRIAACLMVAPVFSAAYVPPRTRLILALAITMLVAPLIPSQPSVAPFSVAGFIVTAQQIIIGAALGFSLQLVFDAITLAGQLLANSMGLGFAFNVDPVHGASTPVVGQLYTIVAMLTFLALNGHLVLIETLVDGFQSLPVGTQGLGSDGLWTVVIWGSQLFSAALSVALPGVTAMLIVNIAFGVMSRAAPTLNLFAVGFPITLVFGILVITAGLPKVQSSFQQFADSAFVMLRSLLGL
jgi:flagellar biosynthetic protein FliR